MSTNTTRSIFGSLGRALAVALLVSLVPACGGGGGGGGGGAPAPFVVLLKKPDPSPSVTQLAPEVYVRFGAVVDSLTVDATTFKVEEPGPIAVPGTFTFTPLLKEVRFVPTGALATTTTYTVTLTAGIKDLTGRALTPDSFTFTTGSQTDSTRPTFAGATGATTPTLNSIDLTWAAATDASGPIAYEVFLSLTSGVYDFTGPPDYSVATLGTTATGLASNTTFYFIVRARDNQGNTELNTVEVSKRTLTSFVGDVYPIVQGQCRSCHIPGGLAQDPPYNITTMDYTSAATTRTTWVGVNVSAYNNADVVLNGPVGAKRVVASDSSKSFVYNKIQSKFLAVLPWAGLGMPRTGGPLSSIEIDTIKTWIDQGALNN